MELSIDLQRRTDMFVSGFLDIGMRKNIRIFQLALAAVAMTASISCGSEDSQERLKKISEKIFFPDDASESELTSLAVSPDGTYAIATRTLITTDSSGAQTDCSGELVFIDLSEDKIGDVLHRLPVGPMPDAVAISNDGKYAVSADERDGLDAWGKCRVTGKLPSISVVDLSQGPASASVRSRIVMEEDIQVTGPREPEYVAISRDNNRVLVTLQDSHEVAVFDISQLPQGDVSSDSDAVSIVKLPPNDLGAYPWPDGILRFDDAAGAEFFAIAGEWNDRLIVVDRNGRAVANKEISASEVPSSFPRLIESGSPLFSPDSLAGFSYGGRPYIAVTLRYAGAVAFYDMSDASAPVWRTAVKVGKNEQGGQDESGSTIRPEGICAAQDGSYVLTANEKESSASLIVPDSHQSDEGQLYLGFNDETILMGKSDNAEIVRTIPGKPGRVLLLSSKARKLTLFEVREGD